MKKPVWCQGNRVPEFVTLRHDVGIPAHSVVIFARENMNAVVQRAPHRNIDFLYAAADSKDRDSALYATADKWQNRFVAFGINSFIIRKIGAAIVVRLDIRQSAGEQQSVYRVEN